MLQRDMEDLITIGQFSDASRLSQKALRLYAENGLLTPAWVDPDSGYRYYDPGQLERATLIALLRRGGMPLAEIGAFLADPSISRLEEFERRTAEAFAERRRVLRYIRRVLKEEPMYDIRTKRVDDLPYVSRSTRTKIDGLDDYILRTVDDLKEHSDGSAPTFVLYHGAVTEEEDGPVEVCVPSSSGDKTLPAGEVVFTEIEGEQCDYPFVLGAYKALYQWAKERERKLAGSPREIYLFEPGEMPRMEIAFPLQ
jgi:DNA-binding transcriptional MerR regulator